MLKTYPQKKKKNKKPPNKPISRWSIEREIRQRRFGLASWRNDKVARWPHGEHESVTVRGREWKGKRMRSWVKVAQTYKDENCVRGERKRIIFFFFFSVCVRIISNLEQYCSSMLIFLAFRTSSQARSWEIQKYYFLHTMEVGLKTVC